MENHIEKPLPPTAMVFGEPKATFSSAKDKVLIADEGMVYVREVAVRAVRWEDVKTATFETMYSRGGTKRHECIVITNMEEKYRFRNEFDNIEEMGQMIVEHAMAIIEPQIRSQLDAGEWVEFGRGTKSVIALHNQNGVRINGDEKHPWENVTSLKREGFFFRLHLKDGRTSKLHYVPQHINLLEELIEELNHD